MTFDFKSKAKVKINIYNYVERMFNEFPIKICNSDTALTPYENNLFEKVIRKRLGKKET